jgi:protein-S-isoprenylcysteine O-methyltransferase Ste14
VTLPDRYLLVRAAAVYIVVVLTGVVWVWRRPTARAISGAVLASFWNVPVVLLLHVAATHFGWWQFDARGGLLLGMPVELYLSWIWLWGAIPALAFPSLPSAIVIEGSGSAWGNPMGRPAWELSLLAQALAVPALLGMTAVQEFVTRGGGTPIPFDPPRRLVTTGVYAYVGNPMQLSAVALLVLLGLVLRNPWVSAAGVMAHVYSAGLAGWDEDADLGQRFEEDWMNYRRCVRRWLPRLRPWHRPDHPPATLFVGAHCEMCRDVARWFERRGARQLSIVPAEMHPSGALRRITYEPADGGRAASGVEAVARALEHIHLGWALVGFVLRLPVVCEVAQLLADASGAEPRSLSPRRRPGSLNGGAT